MSYSLPDDVSFCQVNGCLIFLDVANDRYFHLPKGLEKSFVDFMEGNCGQTLRLAELVKIGVLVQRGNALPAKSMEILERVARSEPQGRRQLSRLRLPPLPSARSTIAWKRGFPMERSCMRCFLVFVFRELALALNYLRP